MEPTTMLTTIGIILILSLLVQITVVTPAHALTRYYNCIARVANKNATLSISNVDACYNMIFKGALDYYGIKQQPKVVVHDNSTSTEENPDGVQKKISSDNKLKTKTNDNSHTYDVFG